MGKFAFVFLASRRHIAEVNLSLCFPEMTEAERKQLASRHYAAVGIGIFETCMAWWAPPSRFPEYRITGEEHLAAARSKGKGVLLFTAHFTTLEMCGSMFAKNHTMGGLFRNPDNPVVSREMHRGRIDQMSAAVAMDDLRGLLRASQKWSHDVVCARSEPEGKALPSAAILRRPRTHQHRHQPHRENVRCARRPLLRLPPARRQLRTAHPPRAGKFPHRMMSRPIPSAPIN